MLEVLRFLFSSPAIYFGVTLWVALIAHAVAGWFGSHHHND